MIQALKAAFNGWNLLIYFVVGCCVATIAQVCGAPYWLTVALTSIVGFILGWNIKSVRLWLRIDKPDA
jgi:ABC-type uncharacterized transport system permease subunit